MNFHPDPLPDNAFEQEEGMSPQVAQILSEIPYAEWKQQYGAVYIQSIGGKLFVFRPLRKAEFEVIASAPQKQMVSTVLQHCILYPQEVMKHLNGMPFKAVKHLSDRVMTVSSWGDPNLLGQLVDNERKISESDPFRVWDTMIMAYCGLKVQEIGNLTADQYVRLVVLAEHISSHGVPVARPQSQQRSGQPKGRVT